MKKFGRVICVTALALSLCLTACGKDDDKKDNKETTTAATEATVDTTEASTEATEDKSEEKSEDKSEEKSEEKTEEKSEEKTDEKSEEKTEEKTEEKSEEASAESVILVGKDGDFKEIKVDISSELSVEDQAAAIISEIGYAIGYQVTALDITNGKGGFSVDFSSDSAPFDVENTYKGNGEEAVPVNGQDEAAKVVFDSIKASFKKYFGDSVDVYFMLNGGDVTVGSLSFSSTEPY